MAGEASTRGWLGWFRVRYEITPDRVTVTRSWVPALMLLAIPVSVWLTIRGLAILETANTSMVPERGAPPPGSVIAGYLAAVVISTVLGIFGLVTTPWFGPRKLVCTREDITIGTQRLERADVAGIGLEHTAQRGKGGTTYTVYIAVQSKFVIDSYRMRILWGTSARPRAVAGVVDAMMALLQPSVAVDGAVASPPDRA